MKSLTQRKNELFDYMNDKHDIMLSDLELEHLLHTVEKDVNQEKDIVNNFRYINVFLFTLLNIVLSVKHFSYFGWIYVIYNIIEIALKYLKNKRLK